MSKILVQIGLVHVVGKFQKETISPEIVHILSEYEMKILGLHKGTVTIYQVEGLENLRGGGHKKLYRYCGDQFLKPLSLGAFNLSLKHLVVKKK